MIVYLFFNLELVNIQLGPENFGRNKFFQILVQYITDFKPFISIISITEIYA